MKILVLLMCTAGVLQAQQPPAGAMSTEAMDSSDSGVNAATDHEMAMAGAMNHDAHMRLTAPRSATPADSARARALVLEMRRALSKYHDVRIAEDDGFRRFLPGVNQPVYHYTNWRWALAARFEFNPDKPTSLLYRERPDGSLELVGAMYTAPAGATEDELNARIPLGIARWHQHVNWCLPPRSEPARWREVANGAPVFGPRSPIATREACDAVGGRFKSRIFGWMVHVDGFANEPESRN